MQLRLRQLRSLSRSTRVAFVVLLIGLVPVSVIAFVQHAAAAKATHRQLDESLANAAAAEAESLGAEFDKGRALDLTVAQNPAFTDLYALPGSLSDRIVRGGPVLDNVNAALTYLERSVYPDSIGEACFIDRGGKELARAVAGVRAPAGDLSPDETSNNPAFRPTLSTPVGHVYQASPYVSPDTHEWVISNSTMLPNRHALVHFELTVESFRRHAAAVVRGSELRLAVVSARTGHVVLQSDEPQRKGAALGAPGEKRFGALIHSGRAVGAADVAGGQRLAFRHLAVGPYNANDWYVVAFDDRAHLSFFSSLRWPLLLLIGLLAATALVIRRIDAQNAELLEADRVKDEFIGTISHELRTPITSIQGYTDLLLEQQSEPDEQRQFLTIVHRNAARLLRLVNDLLFVAQAEAGELEMRMERTDLVEIAAQAVEATRATAEKREVGLTFTSAFEQASVEADPARLGQAIDNLLSNAIKFTPAGGEVGIAVSEQAGQVLITVTDTGMGMTQPELARLFERFFRTKAAQEKSIQGTGLGLTITKAIVKAHGGAITVRSESTVGTSFVIALPLLDSHAQEEPRGRETLALT